MQVVQLPLRALQIIFSAIVLALSVILIKEQYVAVEAHAAPVITKFEAFCGAFGIIVAAVGIVAAFVEAIPVFIMASVDILCTFFFLAGSLAFAVKLGVHSCAPDPGALKAMGLHDAPKNANPYTLFNDVINAGFINTDNIDYPGRCREAQADTAFLFFALACFGASIALDFMGGKGGGGRGGFKMPGRKAGGSNYV